MAFYVSPKNSARARAFCSKIKRVILDAELKFDKHILVKIKKADAVVGLTRRSLRILTVLCSENYSLPFKTISWVLENNIFEKICNHFGKCATPSYKTCGWISFLVLFKSDQNFQNLEWAPRRNCAHYVYRPVLTYTNSDLKISL